VPADEVRLPLTAVSDPAGAFARSVQVLRVRRDWTVTRLAAEAGVSQGAISRLEGTLAGCYLDTAWKLAEALEVPVDAMVRGEIGRYLAAPEAPPERNWLGPMPEADR
jgi:transcriptional regulator with XRE-family HTH domain